MAVNIRISANKLLLTDSEQVDKDVDGLVKGEGTGFASCTWTVDEDNMASDSAVKVPTQQSVKAYVDAGTLYVTTIASSATPTPARLSKRNMFTVTALAAAAVFAVPSGTPAEGDTLLVRIKDNGVARALDFNAIYRFSTDLPKPTTTILGKTMYLLFVYNNTDTKWDNLAFLDNI